MEYMSNSLSADSMMVDPRCSVPNYYRDDFVRLATVLDLVLLDSRSLKYKYSELAAAIVFSSFDPPSLIEKVTGYGLDQITPIMKFVRPFVEVCERYDDAPVSITYYDDLPAVEYHNIQTFVRGMGDRHIEAMYLAREYAIMEKPEDVKRKKTGARKRQYGE